MELDLSGDRRVQIECLHPGFVAIDLFADFLSSDGDRRRRNDEMDPPERIEGQDGAQKSDREHRSRRSRDSDDDLLSGFSHGARL
jgi:hypothetical protein